MFRNSLIAAAAIVPQPRTGAPRARQGAELELPARDCGSRGMPEREWERFPCEVIWLARRLIRVGKLFG